MICFDLVSVSFSFCVSIPFKYNSCNICVIWVQNPQNIIKRKKEKRWENNQQINNRITVKNTFGNIELIAMESTKTRHGAQNML